MKAEERFSDRVDAYEKGRPAYPAAVARRLTERLDPDSVVADVGAGTGLLTRDFLAAGYTVHAIEPNGPMREAMEATLADRAGFHAWNGTAAWASAAWTWSWQARPFIGSTAAERGRNSPESCVQAARWR